MKIYFLFFLLLLGVSIYAQNSFEGGIYSPYHHCYSSEMIETSTNDYLLIGSYTVNGGFSGGIPLTKLDSDGNILWQKIFPSPGGSYAGGNFVKELSNGDYLMNGVGIDYNGDSLTYCYFIKTDTAGNLIWTKFLGGIQYNFRENDFISDLNGGFISIGSRDSLNNTKALIVKYDSAGNVIFYREYLDSMGASYSHGYNINDFVRIIQVYDSSYYILSSFNGNPIIIHLNNEGDSVSAIPILDSLSITEINLIVDFKLKDNKLISCIGTIDTSSQTLVKEFYYEVDFVNFSSHKQITTKVISFYPLDGERRVVLGVCNNNFNSQNAFIEKRDSNDFPIWSYCIHPQYGGINSTRFNLSKDNGILFTSSIDTINFGAYESMYYLKLDSNGQLLNTNMEIYHDDLMISIYPDPVKDKLFINSSGENIKQIKILDLLGHELMYYNGDVQNELDVRELQGGIYFISIKLKSSLIIRKFIKL